MAKSTVYRTAILRRYLEVGTKRKDAFLIKVPETGDVIRVSIHRSKRKNDVNLIVARERLEVEVIAEELDDSRKINEPLAV